MLWTIESPVQREESYDPQASLEACDEGANALAGPDLVQLGPLLDEFRLLMADHGHQVRVDLMRRDREYAMWQLARARTTGDPVLRELACRLFGRLQRRGNSE
jgi:hypothetical protein